MKGGEVHGVGGAIYIWCSVDQPPPSPLNGLGFRVLGF